VLADGKPFYGAARQYVGDVMITANVPYRFSEVVHGLMLDLPVPPPATAGEQLRRRTGCCYLESGRRTNLTLLSQRTSLIRLFDGDRTQSYSHAHSDAGTSCLALYDLQPVTDYTKNQPHETKQLS